MSNKPLVSVIIRTFNQSEKVLDSCIGSIVAQTYDNWELLLSDDSTSTDSIGLINRFADKDKRILTVRRPERMGLVGSLNTAIKASKGEFVAVLDADDIAVPTRLDKQVAYFEEHPECDVLGGAMNIINESSEKTSVRYYPKGGLKLLLWMMFRDPIGHPTVMFRKKVFNDGLYYDEGMRKGCEDTEIWFRLRNNGYIIRNLQEPLVNYRVAEDMANKREADNKQNLIARKKNFSLKYCIFDSVSLVVIMLRMCLPKSIVSWAYSKENNQKY